MSFEFDLINYINQLLNKKNIKIRNDLNNLNLKKKFGTKD